MCFHGPACALTNDLFFVDIIILAEFRQQQCHCALDHRMGFGRGGWCVNDWRYGGVRVENADLDVHATAATRNRPGQFLPSRCAKSASGRFDRNIHRDGIGRTKLLPVSRDWIGKPLGLSLIHI